MDTSSRRHFVRTAASLAAMAPTDKFDLLIRNANVLDPSQGLTGPAHWHSLRAD